MYNNLILPHKDIHMDTLKKDNSVFLFTLPNGDELINILKNGDVYIKGKYTSREKDLVEALKEFFNASQITTEFTTRF